jgi:hypothetical protein
MTPKQLRHIRDLQGRRVSVALTDGSRIDDCQLVSVGRHRLGGLWLFSNGTDVFVAIDSVRDVWEISSLRQGRVA